LYRLRERAAELQRANAQLRDELKRLLVFDRAPGRFLTPTLAERARTLRQSPAADVSARERSFARHTPIYREVRDRMTIADPQPARAVDVFGLTIWVPDDACTDGSLSARILTGRWLPVDEIARVRRTVVGGTMLDIGANVGTTAIPRLALGDFAVVYAAEPHPSNYECLVANVVRNGLEGRLLPDRVAIASWDGEGRLRESSQIGTHHLLLSGRRRPGSTSVPCLTLDSWVKRLGVSPRDITFVKVDVQGWDAHVLLGAPHLRAHRHIAWQIELSPKLLRHAGIDVRVLCSLADATFTHMQPLGAGAGIGRPVTELPALLEGIEAHGSYSNVLFYNQAAESVPLSA
jgi:FkbM family methyltransferase